ncbi:MAG: molecular chaperone TorD family protein [Deferribacteraceae bacterium]|nr:molecular chaperone TorD family protein [Deferribacteraceae bacterium]
MVSDKELLQSSHSGREVVYNLLQRTFINSPDEEYYTMLEALVPDLMQMAEGADDKDMIRGLAGMNAFLQERALHDDSARAEYDLDTLRFYTRILCLTDSVPTVESYYTSPEKLTMQDARDEVLALYAEYGMKKSNTHNEQEDFISVELYFMSYLANLTALAIAENDINRAEELVRVQRDFITDHLDRWAEQFTARLGAYKEAGRLHYPVARFMLGFLRSDKAFLLSEKV